MKSFPHICLRYIIVIILCRQFIFTGTLTGNTDQVQILAVKIRDFNTISIKYHGDAGGLKASDFQVSPELKIHSLSLKDNRIRLETDKIDITKTWYVLFRNTRYEVHPGAVLNEFYTDKELGCFQDSRATYFRLFAPRARWVKLILFKQFADTTGEEHDMNRSNDGVWECRLPGHFYGMYYGYKLDRPAGDMEHFDSNRLFGDPYSRAVATTNDYKHTGKTLILDSSDYNWEGDQPLHYKMSDLVIYECHIRDLTAHPSSGVPKQLAGSYPGLILHDTKGGINYVKALGVNAVEFLPIHDFGNIEYPYGVPLNGVINTWNPYARNHWGYMTSWFFAPESYYASEQNLEPGGVCGLDGRQVKEFKDVVKAFHKEKIAVILDVVFNHVSQYDHNCFKQIDKNYFFRLHDDQSYKSGSGCGNDFYTERPMARKFIVDCIKYWMQEYHIDGFRFDLAAMLDWETIDAIRKEALKINPNVILIAEPWGGGEYEPAEFSKHGWGVWNDQIRNGVKGQYPDKNQSFIFGRFFDFNNPETIKRYILGNLAEDGGLFQKKEHAVNYLESHDDHTLGDFVRIGLGDVGLDQVTGGSPFEQALKPKQLAVNKLGALILFISQGAVMIHEGQEYARSKVIAPTLVPDSHVGKIDHNSYNKDNETNWLNFDHADLNRELVDYYQGLIALRHKHPAFRHSGKKDITFLPHKSPLALSFTINKAGSGDDSNFLALINANMTEKADFTVPAGEWIVIVNADWAGVDSLDVLREKTITLPPTSGMILKQQ